MSTVNRNKIIIAFVSIFIVFSSCTTQKTPYNDDITGSLEMYLLSDSQIKFSEAVKVSINDLSLQKYPIMAEDDIKSYRILCLHDNPWNSHSVKFNSDMRSKFGDEIVPFVIVADNERIYVGEYWPSFFSYLPTSILMVAFRDDEFHISAHDENGLENINNKRIFDALGKAGVEYEYVYMDE